MAKKTRVVFDTNIYISAIVFGGSPRILLEMARSKDIELYTSKAILLELSRKLIEKFDWDTESTSEVISGIGVFANVVSPSKKLHVIKQDDTDNRILECADVSKADFIVSGDKRHILPLKKFGKTRIVTPSEFLASETN